LSASSPSPPSPSFDDNDVDDNVNNDVSAHDDHDVNDHDDWAYLVTLPRGAGAAAQIT
jgi:hypothetical protein